METPPTRSNLNTRQSTRSTASSGNDEFDNIVNTQIEMSTKLEFEKRRQVEIENNIDVCDILISISS